MRGTVLVTGGRGKTGGAVVDLLRAAEGVTLRAGSSRPDAHRSTSVGYVSFDWEDPSTWPAAVDGVDAVYLMRPDLPDAPDRVGRLVDLNRSAHVVLLSEQGAGTLPAGHWAREVEDAVTARAGTWTLLRPSWFQQVLTDPRFYRDSIRSGHRLAMPSGGAPLAWVDARDIASVVVAVLDHPARHHGHALTLTGPEPLSVAAVAEELSAHVGHTVRAVDQPAEDAIGEADPWTSGILDDLYRRVRAGGFADVSTDVERVTGSPPGTLRRFLEDHRHELRSGAA
ncbi:NAD(P)H-binding protein [Kineococcus sp. NUM-3379]